MCVCGPLSSCGIYTDTPMVTDIEIQTIRVVSLTLGRYAINACYGDRDQTIRVVSCLAHAKRPQSTRAQQGPRDALYIACIRYKCMLYWISLYGYPSKPKFRVLFSRVPAAALSPLSRAQLSRDRASTVWNSSELTHMASRKSRVRRTAL